MLVLHTSEPDLLIQLLSTRHNLPSSIPQHEWHTVLRQAKDADVTPVLFHAVRDRRDVPAEVLDVLRMEHHQAVTSNVVLLSELDRILDAFTAHGIPVILLKGACFFRHHGWHIGLRRMADLDLLIRRADLQPAAETLAAVGYVQEPDDLAPGFSQEFLGECSFVKAGPRVCRLDLHHKLYVFGEARHENDHVWDRSQPVPNALQTVRALSLEDEVHYLAYHLAFHHRGEGVRWFADLARLVQQCHDRLDWDALLNMTARCATGLALHTALEGAHALGAPVPNCVLRALSGYRPPFGERIFYALVSDSKFTWHARTLAVLPSIPGIRPKLTYLRAKLFPAPAHAGKAYSPDGTYRRTTALLRMISIAANCLRGIAMTARALLRPYRDTNGFPFTRKR